MMRRETGRSELDDALALAIGQMHAHWHQRLRSIDLTPPQFITLRMLAESPLPMRTVADKLMCDASNMTGIADRLEERGLVVRRAEPADRRVKLLDITEAGRAVLDTIDSPMIDEFDGLAALTAGERDQLASLLRRAFS